MQILHPFSGSIQQYSQQLQDPNRYRPPACPLCKVNKPLRAHGYYCRTLVAEGFDGVLRVRRYLCRSCGRTTSLLPEFALPYARFAVPTIGRFLQARLSQGHTLGRSAELAGLPGTAYQRGQHWVARFTMQSRSLVAALSSLIRPLPAPHFLQQALGMLDAAGWIHSHRFLFSQLRVHLLGWPPFLVPDGRSRTLSSPRLSSAPQTHNTCIVESARGP